MTDQEQDAYFERMKETDPEMFRRLMESLPDVRDGLNVQQRALLVQMHRLGLTHDSRMKSTAYVCFNTRAVGFEKEPAPIRTHLKEVHFNDDGSEKERYYTPDLGL